MEINWGYNCLTVGIHHGRPEALWNLPLGYAAQIYGNEALEQIVVARIYNDAMQFVNHSEAEVATQEWADRIKRIAQEQFQEVLQSKVQDLAEYYQHTGWKCDIRDLIIFVELDKLNPNYSPLHSHDSINLLCRILGTRASRMASKA